MCAYDSIFFFYRVLVDMNPFYKTNACKFLPTCRNGDKCVYAHTPQEIRRVVTGKDLSPHDRLYRTKMCDYKDLCVKEDCGYAHSGEELRRIPCRFQSFCRSWETCRYSHFFVDGDGVFAPPVVNNSVAMKTKRAFDATGQQIERLAHELDNLYEDGVAAYLEMEALVNERDATAREIQDVTDEIGDMITELDEMIDSLEGKQRTRWGMRGVRKDWADDDSGDENGAATPQRLWSSLF